VGERRPAATEANPLCGGHRACVLKPDVQRPAPSRSIKARGSSRRTRSSFSSSP
jgi:hypothetical protein